MKCRILFIFCLVSFFFYGCAGKVAKYLDEIDAEIDNIERLCEGTKDGTVSSEQFAEEYPKAVLRVSELIVEAWGYADYMTEEETFRLTKISEAFDELTTDLLNILEEEEEED